jgi:hypothetical protein
MDETAKLSELVDLAESIGLSVRTVPPGADATHIGGALVRLKGKEIIFLDPDAAVADQISVIAEALRGRSELEGMFLTPEIRQAIDEQKTGN